MAAKYSNYCHGSYVYCRHVCWPTDYCADKKLGAIAMLLASTGMGLVGTISRIATNGLAEAHKPAIDSFLAFGRMFVALIGFIVIVLASRKVALLRRTRLSFAVVMGGVSIGLSLGCYITSTLMTSLVNAVFLIYTGPIFYVTDCKQKKKN